MKFTRKDNNIGNMNFETKPFSKNVANSAVKSAEKVAKSLDRTYSGRIVDIIEQDGKKKYKVFFGTGSQFVELNEGTHYINEVVRVYVPNGDMTRAYGESVVPVPCSKVIISKNQMVFQTTVSTTVFSSGDDGEPKVEMTEVDLQETIELTRDSLGRPVSLKYPDQNEVIITYAD